MGRTLFSLLKVASIAFITKTVLEVLLQWMFTSLDFNAHIWGRFTKSIGYIWYDFLLHFWAYILIASVLYLVMNYFKKINPWILYTGSSIMIIAVLLDQHGFQFPMKQYYFPSRSLFNFKLVEEVAVYLLPLLVMVYLLKQLIAKAQTP